MSQPTSVDETAAALLPPYSAEAERGVLGSLLMDAPRVIETCYDHQVASPDAFFVPAHRVIFSAIQHMFGSGLAIDAVTVTDNLRAGGELDAAGGPGALEKILDSTPSAAHAEYYIEIVRQKALLRRALDCARRIERDCYDHGGDMSADELVSMAEQQFMEVAGDKRKGGIVSWKDALLETYGTIEKLLQGGVSGVSTGFANLDAKMRGLRNGEMIVLAARPSMGKTSLSMNICEHLASGVNCAGRPLRGGFKEYGGKVPVAIFSLEMSQYALAMRMVCAKARISASLLESGNLNAPKARQKFQEACGELQKCLMYVDDTGGIDVLELRSRARRMKRQYGIGLIMIDYLQLLNCREYAKQGRQLEVAAISANLKAMAKELNVPVIVLSQLSRGPEQRSGKQEKPRLSDLRDSGAIEQDADVVLLLRRPCKMPGTDNETDRNDETLAIVDVAKHRNGPVGEVRLNFDAQYTQFSDRDDGPGSDDSIPVQ
ncbi:MAG: replicative DNA helicase [Kiritimatiellae bacterium]|nr:replicative DNA helicase [Kiritimatiellia bacterium]